MKKVNILVIMLLVMSLLSGCFNDKSSSTNLSNISADNIKINSNVNNIDFSKYTKSNKYQGDYRYKFDELLINTTKDKVSFMFIRLDNNKIDFKINSKGSIKNISDVTNLLGSYFKDSLENKDKSLRKRTYYDKTRGIKADFIYSDIDEKLYWVEIYYA